MKVLILTITIIATLILLRSLFLGSAPKYNGISLKQLQRYMSYLIKALDNRGYIEFIPDGFEGPITLRKKEFSTKQNELLVELSSGFHSREKLETISEALTEKDIEHRLTFTKKKGLPKRLIVTIQATEILASSTTTHVIDTICNTFEGQEDKLFSLTLWGPFKVGFTPEDGDVFEHLSSFKLGRFVGYILGSFLKIKNK